VNPTAAIELYPVTGKEVRGCSRRGGIHARQSSGSAGRGDNRAGLGYAIAQAIADAGINMDFLVAQVVGRKYSAVFWI